MSYVIPPDLRRFAANLSKACQLARRDGWKIVAHVTKSEIDKVVCPVGALLHFADASSFQVLILNEFILGFDNCIDRARLSPHYELGREFRKRFCG
jgi:hypothetical protein